MKKKRIFKRILVFIAVLVGTIGIGAVSASIAHAASTNSVNREYFVINSGVHNPVTTEPNFEGISDDLIIPFVFEHTDENSEIVTRYDSIYVEYNNGTYSAYFNFSTNQLSPDARLFADSNQPEWLMDIKIRTLQEQRIENVEGYQFLINTYGSSMIESQYLISGRYEFNDSVIENTFGETLFDVVFNVRGHLASPMQLTSQQIEDLLGVSGLRGGNYYISSFRAIRLSASTTAGFDSIEFELYIPSANIWVWVNVLDESTGGISDYYNARTVIFDGSQYVDSDFYHFLDVNGYFGPPILEPDTTYTPTDLVFAVVDAPIRFIQSLMSFELFGMGFFLIFASIMTISIGLWIIFGRSK